MEDIDFFDELKERNKSLSILSEVSRTVHRHVDLKHVYKTILEITNDIKFIDLLSVHLVEGEGDKREAVLQIQHGYPDEYLKKAGRIPYGIGSTWKVITTGEPVFYEDASHPSTPVGPAGKALGQRAILSVPVKSDDETIGVIHFSSFEKTFFSQHELDFLFSLGSQIGTAIAKAKMCEEMRRREEELKRSFIQLSRKNLYETIISAVTQSVHKSIALQDVLENAVDTMSKNIDTADNVSIYLVEDEEAVLKSYRGYPDWWVGRVRRIPYPQGFTWKTIIEGKLTYCADVDGDTVIGAAGREMGTRSYASMPIHFSGKTVGAININSLKKNAFDEEELKLLEIVARQIETAINNARRAEALWQSEEALRKSKDELEIKVEERTAELRNANERLLAEVAERKRKEEEVKNSRKKLRALAARLQSVREVERRQIAREVHDELGQVLTGLKMDVSWLGTRLSKIHNQTQPLDPLMDKTRAMADLIDTTVDVVHRIATNLRPGMLDSIGLIAAMEWQAQEFQKRMGIECEFISWIESVNLDEERSTAVFRIFQETLTNVARHADAAKVNVRLKEDAGEIVLEVEDNGRGIRRKEISDPKSLGLLGIRERALLFGGEISFRGRRGKGTTVTVRVPTKR